MISLLLTFRDMVIAIVLSWLGMDADKGQMNTDPVISALTIDLAL